MPDAQNAAAAPVPVRRENYRPPDWLVPRIELEFELGAERTRVRSRLEVERNGGHQRPLKLDAQGFVPAEVMLDGERAEYVFEDDGLIPNSLLPLVIRQGAVTPDADDPPKSFE